MTPTEWKALGILKNREFSMRATQFAEEMGWARTPQGAARVGAGYLARLAKKGWVEISHTEGRGISFRYFSSGYFAKITPLGINEYHRHYSYPKGMP